MRHNILLAATLLAAAGCASDPAPEPATYDYGRPVQATSPWPAFRRTLGNSGRSPIVPRPSKDAPWAFATGKGMFHAPAIDGDGTVYIGSADTFIYAIRPDGTEKWRFPTGEIVDSSALIGDDGTIYVPAGDGNLYALNPDGTEQWRLQSPGKDGFITWWEGHIAMSADGTLVLGNDDFHVYAVRRDGTYLWDFPTGDQVWSCAGFTPDGTLLIGSNDVSLRALAPDGTLKARWTTLGPVTSSPAVADDGSLAVVGSFDGFVHAVDPARGEEAAWTFATRDHIYGSAAVGADGTFYIGSADGTLYALAPDGTQRWAFDTLDPIRSSPAIDGEGTVYFGGADGRLYALNPDGTRKWSFDTSTTDRNDLNGSPALGNRGVYIGGEAGALWFVPYDWCDRSPGDTRCVTDPGEDLAPDGAFLFHYTPGGDSRDAIEDPWDAMDVATFRLVVRGGGDTVQARIDPARLEVAMTPDVPFRVEVSANGQFVNVVPTAPVVGFTEGTLALSGTFLVGGQRIGNKVVGGEDGGTFSHAFPFSVAAPDGETMPLRPPDAGGTQVFLMRGLAVPQPPLMTTFNQLGFASYNYLLGVLSTDPGTGDFLMLAVEGTPGLDPRIRTDTTSAFVLNGRSVDRAFEMSSEGFQINFGALAIGMDLFRTSGRMRPDGQAPDLHLFAEVVCSDIGFYGALVDFLGMCHPDSGKLVATGTANLAPWTAVPGKAPEGVSARVVVSPGAAGLGGTVEATFEGPELAADNHLPLVVLADPATGRAVECRYGANTRRLADGNGTLRGVRLDVPDDVDATRLTPIVTLDLGIVPLSEQ